MSFQRHAIRVAIGGATALLVAATALQAQSAPPKPTPTTTPAPSGAPKATPAPEPPPAGYVIGVDDALRVDFWRDPSMSADVVVRPDGKITLPLLNEIEAVGLTPAELQAVIVKASMKYLTEEPTVAVIVKTINSRAVYIQGMVGKTGRYPLTPGMTVVQLIATAGGLAEYAHSDRIQIIRMERGQPKSYLFNYKDFSKGKPAALKQNIELKIGDTVIVP